MKTVDVVVVALKVQVPTWISGNVKTVLVQGVGDGVGERDGGGVVRGDEDADCIRRVATTTEKSDENMVGLGDAGRYRCWVTSTTSQACQLYRHSNKTSH